MEKIYFKFCHTLFIAKGTENRPNQCALWAYKTREDEYIFLGYHKDNKIEPAEGMYQSGFEWHMVKGYEKLAKMIQHDRACNQETPDVIYPAMPISPYQKKIVEERKRVAFELYKTGMTTRKVGEILNRSHNWVSQTVRQLSTVLEENQVSELDRAVQ